VSPSAEINEGTRTGHYRIGTNQLLVDASGRSHISMEDFAAAILDEVEKPQFGRNRFTVGTKDSPRVELNAQDQDRSLWKYRQ